MDERDQSQAHQAFELEIRVEAADIDQFGHVNNVTYVRWVQDIALAHWNAIAPEDEKRKLFWVVLRHEIDYKQAAFAGDALLARTWVGQATKLRYERHTEFIRRSDGKPLAKARTIWCPIDVGTGRPVEVSQQLKASFLDA